MVRAPSLLPFRSVRVIDARRKPLHRLAPFLGISRLRVYTVQSASMWWLMFIVSCRRLVALIHFVSTSQQHQLDLPPSSISYSSPLIRVGSQTMQTLRRVLICQRMVCALNIQPWICYQQLQNDRNGLAALIANDTMESNAPSSLNSSSE